jgi:hypothetical protein
MFSPNITQSHLMKLKFFFIFWLLFISRTVFAQVIGKITAEDSTPIPFASVYIHQTQSGQISNEEGVFYLNLPEGKYKLTFQCMGFQSLDTTVNISKSSVFNVQLKENAFSLPEVIVSKSDFERGDIIIRKAIAAAPFNRDKILGYEMESYIKGSGRIKKLPKFLNNPSDLSLLDSTKAFVLESKSKIVYSAPGVFKETLLEYKEMGTDNPISVPYLYPDFYLEVVADALSPLASNALNHYDYKLENTFVDRGQIIYQLQVYPKKNGPGWFAGTLYLTEKNWSIYGVNLSTILNGFNLTIKQNFSPVYQEVWLPITNQIEFSGDILGTSFSYLYLANLTNYRVTVQPDSYFEKYAPTQDVFTDPFLTLDKKEIKKSRKEIKTPKSEVNIEFSDSLAVGFPLQYWDSIRPIPLNPYEVRGTQYIDSLTSSLTSINSSTTSSFPWVPLLMSFQFNPVEGFHLYHQFDFRKNKKLSFSFTPRLSLADQKFRWQGQITYPFRYFKTKVEFGQYIFQYGQQPPINPWINSYQNLFFDKNNIRLYHKNFIRLAAETAADRPFQFAAAIEKAERFHLKRNTTQTWLNRPNREYEENHPNNPLFGKQLDNYNQTWLLEGLLRWSKRPASKGAVFELLWRSGITTKTFHLLQISHQNHINFPARGSLDYYIELGGFWNANDIPFQDVKHFSGNASNFFSKGPIGNFRTLGFYQKSTNESFLQMSVQYQMKKFLLSQFPIFWKQGLKEGLFSSFIANQSFVYHAEIGYSISNILRFIRLEVVAGLEPNQPLKFKWMLGLSTFVKLGSQ